MSDRKQIFPRAIDDNMADLIHATNRASNALKEVSCIVDRIVLREKTNMRKNDRQELGVPHNA